MGNSIRNYEFSLAKACEEDKLELVQKYISKLELKNTKIDLILNKCFEISCINGSLNTLIWLSSLPKIKINYKTLNIILIKNYFEIFLVLVNKSLIKVDIKLFERSCKYNEDITKWIYTVSKLSINNNIAFFNACTNNKIKIIDFFIDNGFDIENNDDCIFKNACKFCDKKILDILCSKCPRYEYVMNGKFRQPIIKDKVNYLIENEKWCELVIFLKINLIDNFEAKECIISFEDSNLITNCGHHYDFRHLCDWYKKKNLCPMCSRKIIFSKCKINKNFINNT